jgi:hypothetical protein
MGPPRQATGRPWYAAPGVLGTGGAGWRFGRSQCPRCGRSCGWRSWAAACARSRGSRGSIARRCAAISRRHGTRASTRQPGSARSMTRSSGRSASASARHAPVAMAGRGQRSRSAGRSSPPGSRMICGSPRSRPCSPARDVSFRTGRSTGSAPTSSASGAGRRPSGSPTGSPATSTYAESHIEPRRPADARSRSSPCPSRRGRAVKGRSPSRRTPRANDG